MIRRLYSSLRQHYEILEIKPGASAEEIKTAYKRLVMKYHPDTSKIADKNLAAEKFKKIHEAKTILLDSNPNSFNSKPPSEENYNPDIFKTYEEFTKAQENLKSKSKAYGQRKEYYEREYDKESERRSRKWDAKESIRKEEEERKKKMN